LVKTVKRIVGLLILAGLGWLGWQHFFPNEEHRIRRMLDDLAQTASIPASESVVSTGLAVENLLSYATPDIEVDVEVPGEGRHLFSGRQEVRDAALLARRNLGELKVQFLDVDVALAGDKQTATAELTVKATQPGAKEFLVQELKLQLRKEDGQWRVRQVETVKPLKL
jgi:ketosteroid isomerase-like protein